MTKSAISLDQAMVRHDNHLLFEDFSLHIQGGEHWGILGHSGSGKTSLLKLLKGLLPITHGNQTCLYKRDEIGFLTSDYHFKNNSNINDFFYQQRYNSTLSDDAPKVKTLLEQAATAATSGFWTQEKVIDLLRIDHLLNEEVIKLSNGETKRLRLATLLIGNPKLLLLDTPLVGLDVKTRDTFELIFQKIADSGIQLVMTLEPGEIPSVITNALILDHFKITDIFIRSEFDQIELKTLDTFTLNQKLLSQLLNESIPEYNQVIRMKDVNIRYDDRQILDHINWEVKQGEHWALRGANGAGKSTLLSLVNGDNPQAYANDIVLFDRKKGSGETIWSIKRKIGYVSPEMLHYFRTSHSCLHVILSGLREGPYPERVTAELNEKAKNWMKLLGIEEASDQLFKTCSPTTQRLTLLARALLKNPVLLVLDEPCQGLDQPHTQRIQEIIDQICSKSPVTLVYVTHYQQELPTCIDHAIELEAGKRIL